MNKIELVVSNTRVNSYLKVADSLFSLYRLNLATGIIRVAQIKNNTETLTPLENIERYGVTHDGVICEIAETFTHEEVIAMIEKELVKELKYFSTKPVLTTDGYYPCLRVGDKAALGLKRRDDGYEIYKAFVMKAGQYEPLVTDKCYFSNAFRLLMPAPMLLKHILENLGWIADPYDWTEFDWAEKKKWVELPPMAKP